jgi:hypothetical protein
VLVGAYSPEEVAANARLPAIAPGVLAECGEATAALKAAVGGDLDGWSRRSRIDRDGA